MRNLSDFLVVTVLLEEEKPFLKGVGAQNKRANLYPEDLSEEEFERFLSSLSKEKQEEAKGFFHLIRRDSNANLRAVPYSEEYGGFLAPVSKLLEEASLLTENKSLAKFLSERARALLSNSYRQSDALWMDVESSSMLDVTLGPYEVYLDKFQNLKSTFESFVAVRDVESTSQLDKYSSELQLIEDNLPIEEKYKSKEIGNTDSPLVAVNLVFSSGDVCGPQTVAFCLPNDEVVRKEKGSKRVMLKFVSQIPNFFFF